MSEQHTATPWKVTTNGPYFQIEQDVADRYVGIGDTCATCCNGDYELGEANARRIVDCVNFCEGISSADIERLQGVENGLMRVIDRAKEFKQQRDDLLAALKAAVKTAESGQQIDFEQFKAFKRAIAKAEQ